MKILDFKSNDMWQSKYIKKSQTIIHAGYIHAIL